MIYHILDEESTGFAHVEAVEIEVKDGHLLFWGYRGPPGGLADKLIASYAPGAWAGVRADSD